MNFLHNFRYAANLPDFYNINNGIYCFEEISVYGGDGLAYLNSLPTLKDEKTQQIIDLYLKH